MVRLVQLVASAQQAQKVVHQDQLAIQEPQVQPVQQVHAVLVELVQQVHKVILAPQVQLDQQDPQVRKVFLVKQVIQVTRAMMEQREIPEPQVQLAQQDPKVILAPQVQPVRLDHAVQVEQAQQAPKVILELQAQQVQQVLRVQ